MKSKIIPLVATMFLSSGAMATESSHKLFAGMFESADELKQIIKEGDHQTQSTGSVVSCTAGTQFGAAYMLDIPQKLQRESRNHTFTETWTYPEMNGQSATTASRQIAGKFKRLRSNPLFSGSVMAEGVEENSEFHLEVSKDGVTYLEHTFTAMGCSDETMQALNDALSAEDPHRLICETKRETGSRLKKRVCMTQQERKEIRDRMEMDLRNSS